ncbi:hypothetical protein BGZ94_004280 [Podila epigama]|nr:hypothetical protein BGZ94_004280 [Podila epigama]
MSPSMENPDHIAWAVKKGNSEHVSMTSFAIKFNYSDRHTAEEDFKALVSNPKIAKVRRQRLLTNLTTFNANQADGFWAKRATIAQADIIAMKAAADSMEVGYRQSKIIYGHHFDKAEQDGVVEDGEVVPENGSNDAERREAGSADVIQDDLLNREEMSSLLGNIVKAQHPVGSRKKTPELLVFSKITKGIVFKRYTITSFAKRILRTLYRMRAIFKTKVLSQLVPSFDLPDPDIDDAAVLKAVRLRIKNKREDASEPLRGLDRKLRLMFDNLLESLPEEVDRSISEVTFTVNYVSPVINSILKINGKTEVHYPNTESLVQKTRV